MEIRCICIDDSNRPGIIPASKWPVKDQMYHIIFVAFCLPQKCQGFQLKEINLDQTTEPYLYYQAKRFGILKEDWEKFLELCKDCTDLDDVSVVNLVESLNLELV